MNPHHHGIEPARRLRALLQLLAVLAVLLLQDHAVAAIFAPMCDPSGATMPVAAPASEGDVGSIDAWNCGDGLLPSRAAAFNSVPARGGESEVGAAPGNAPATPSWGNRFPVRPIQKRLIWGEGPSVPLPNGYATGPFRPPRLTNQP
jgi:hypothetical protein